MSEMEDSDEKLGPSVLVAGSADLTIEQVVAGRKKAAPTSARSNYEETRAPQGQVAFDQESTGEKISSAASAAAAQTSTDTESSTEHELAMPKSSKREHSHQQEEESPPFPPNLDRSALRTVSQLIPGAYAMTPTDTGGQDQQREVHIAPRTYADLLEGGMAIAMPVSNRDQESREKITLAQIQDPRREMERKTRERKKWYGQAAALGAVGVCLILAVVIPIVFLSRTTSSSSDTSTSTVPIQVAMEIADTVKGVLPDYTMEAVLGNSRSPQARAYEWILGDPVLSLEEWRIKQRFALVTLYYATNGDEWNSNTHWLDHSVHECQWFGQSTFGPDKLLDPHTYVHVEHHNPCEQDPENQQQQGQERFKHLWLHNNNLQGSLPPEIFWLTSLRSLSTMINDELTGTLPTQTGLLTKLEAINIGATKLSGSIPSQLGLLSSSMTSIAFINCQLEGAIPSQIGQLTQLHDLLLVQNQLTSLPAELIQLSNLVWIYLEFNLLTGNFPLWWMNHDTLPLLEDMGLSSNLLSGSIPSELGLLPSMAFMYLNDNTFEQSIPSTIGNLIDLEVLHLDKNAFTSALPSDIGMLSKLYWMDANHNQLIGQVPTQIGLLSSLVRLNLHHNHLSGPLPSQLGQLQMLNNFSNYELEDEEVWVDKSILNLGSNQLTGTLPSELDLLWDLLVLDIANNSQLSGTISDALCAIETLEFDCSSQLCGCHCSCLLHNNTTAPQHS